MTATADPKSTSLEHYDKAEGGIHLTGLRALVRLILDHHDLDVRRGLHTATLVSGYEGSPLAGFDLELLRQTTRLQEHEVVFQPAVNEELAANAVQGSQLAGVAGDPLYDGVVGVWYGKAPGLDRATDALRHGCLGGSSPTGGVVLFVGDDSIAKSSTVPSSSEVAMAEIGMAVLSPADPQDVIELGQHAIELSRFSGLWAGLKMATNVVDGTATAAVSPTRVAPVEPDRTIDGTPYAHQPSAQFLGPALVELEQSLTGARPELARRYARANNLNRIEGDPHARVGIVAAGSSWLDVHQALNRLGLSPEALATSGIRILKLGLVSPLEPTIVHEFADGLDEILVVEEKRAFIELAIKDLFYGHPGAPAISGRRTPLGEPLLRADSDLPPELIAAAIEQRFGDRVDLPADTGELDADTSGTPYARKLLPLAIRTPYFCSGCPHNRSTAVPDGTLVGAGIGCHALAIFMGEDRVGDVIGLCQMGGEGAVWNGMSPFVSQTHLVQNLGDGTYHHSGSLAVRSAIAAGSNITYKLLYNGAVAMTGGQDAVGKMSIPEVITELLTEGVKKVVVTTGDPGRYRRIKLPKGVTVRHRDDLIDVQNELAEIPGVTVIVHDQECATELRRKRKRGLAKAPTTRVFINERVCEGCGDCGDKSNCLSVQPISTEFGRKTQIHQPSCNQDFSCLNGDCPSFVAVTKAGRARAGAAEPLDAADLPAPPAARSEPIDFTMRVTGIGGTGVVTVTQVLSTAAAESGLGVRALDQMGMSQKGGAVVSDLHFTQGESLGANKLATGECDLYLGCDLLVAADPTNLVVASQARSVAVVSTADVPTGAMVSHVDASFPDIGALCDAIASATHSLVAVDARAETLRSFGDDQCANVFLIGVAVQEGVLPLDPNAIEHALELNGVAVDRNVQAFRQGRRWFVEHGSAGYQPATPETLDELVSRRVGELTAYQDASYARTYADFVTKVRGVESARLGDTALTVDAGSISAAVARNLYKLMAYKDEYEVARLSTSGELRKAVEAAFGEGATYAYKLHPPVLRAMGMDRKITLGTWADPGLRTLYGMRRLRGTRLDPFGRAPVRKAERDLIQHYRALVEFALDRLTPENADVVVEIAELPDVVRGYEQIKLDNIDRYLQRADALTARLQQPVPESGAPAAN